MPTIPVHIDKDGLYDVSNFLIQCILEVKAVSGTSGLMRLIWLTPCMLLPCSCCRVVSRAEEEAMMAMVNADKEN